MSTAAVTPGFLPTLRDLVALTKPRVTSLVLATAAVGMAVARGPVTVTPLRVTLMLLGTWLCVASANALNCFLERESDGRMLRTRSRPLPAGRLDMNLARSFGLLLGVVSLPVLALAANVVTMVLGLVALVSYVGVYTPLKNKSPLALVIGAVPGALPPLMGYAAISGRIEPKGVLLFALLFLWQLPHVIGLSAFRREEYIAAGIKVLPAVTSARATRMHAVLWALALCAVSFVPSWLGWTGWLYLVSAAALGCSFVAATLRPTSPATLSAWGKRVFLTSLVYLPLLFAALLIDGRA
jgi:protoheme IX farnesyltransferase